MATYTIIPLHTRTELTEDCVSLLNAEWPRSRAARLHHLKKSCDNLPYSLVMLQKHVDNTEEVVVGYCRLAKVMGEPNGIFVESVVVDKARRGHGLGRKLMDLAEIYAKEKNYKTIYLCTKDKQGFYEHLGYSFYKPVNTIGAQMLETCDCQLSTNTPLEGQSVCDTGCDDVSPRCNTSTTSNNGDCRNLEPKPNNKPKCKNTLIQPPPPPPPPPVIKQCEPTIYWMKKQLV